jgi:nicotinamidase-related amidase
VADDVEGEGRAVSRRADPPFLLEQEKTALVVVDMQNDFVREGAPQEVPDARKTFGAIQKLLQRFRESDLPVVYTKFIAGPRETLMWTWSPECGPDQRSCWKGVRRFYRDVGKELEGPDVVDELAPDPKDHVVEKYGYDAFFRSALDHILRANHVEYLVVCGTVTQICVEDTVHGAFHHGYRAVAVSDAVSSYDDDLHRSTLRNIELKYGRVLATDEVLAELGAAPS